jgi:hypothetical protein
MTARHIIVGLVAAVLGGAIGVGGSAIYYQRSAALFTNRLRCKTLAEEYISKSDSSPLLEQVGFSQARNSCVASTFTLHVGFSRYEVVDIVSNEKLFSESCDYSGGKCGGGVNIRLSKAMQNAFTKAVGR